LPHLFLIKEETLSKNNLLKDNRYYSIRPASSKESRNTLLILLLIILLGLFNVYFNPLQPFFNNVLGVQSVNGCPLLTFTGLPCPMCGMGRVFSCMTDFYISQSFYYNPLGLLFYILLGFIVGTLFILSLTKRKVILKKSAQKLWYIPVLFIVIMWILNIIYGHHH
jgi:hypothetical protein